MWVKHTSYGLILNIILAIALFIASIKIVGTFSIDIQYMFNQIMTRKCLMLVFGCTSFALTLTRIFKMIENRCFANLVHTKPTKIVPTITPLRLSM
jgi:hypothetical protein